MPVHPGCNPDQKKIRVFRLRQSRFNRFQEALVFFFPSPTLLQPGIKGILVDASQSARGFHIVSAFKILDQTFLEFRCQFIGPPVPIPLLLYWTSSTVQGLFARFATRIIPG